MNERFLTKGEILERLGDIFGLIELDAQLTQEQADLLDYNFAAIKYFVELQQCRDFTEVGRIGFGDDEDEGEADEDEEEEE